MCIMDESKQASLVYDKIAEPYAKEFTIPSEHINAFLDLLPKNASVLDAGCGFGVDAEYMQSKGCKVIGIDLSKKMIQLAKQNFPQIIFRQQDIRKLHFEPHSFEGILASYSFIHIPKKDVPLLLQTFHKILKENGILYLGLQSGQSKEIFINEPFKPDEKLFLNIISFDEIKKLLLHTGFYIIKKYERKSKSEVELDFTKVCIIAKK